MMKFIASFLLLFIFSINGYAEENHAEVLCNLEIEKDKFDVGLIEKYCSEVGDYYFEKEDYISASWYYLLGGKNDKNINEVQLKIEDGFLVNVGHAYLLKEEFNLSKKMYKIFLKNSTVPLADEAIKDDFKLLLKLFPRKKDSLKRGLLIWNKIYKPLHPIKNLYKNYQKFEKKEKYKQAIHQLELILDLQKKYHHNLLDMAITYNDIGANYSKMGNFSKALIFYSKDLNITESILGKEHSSTVTIYNNIGSVYNSMGDFQKALEFYSKDLNITKKNLDEDNASIVSNYNNMGLVYQSMGEFQKALTFHTKALKLLSKNHLYTANTYNGLGLVYNSMGEFSKALDYYNKALQIQERTLGKNHTDTAITYNNIGGVYRSMKNFPKALDFYTKDLNITRNILGSNNLRVATSYNNIGEVYDSLGQYLKALEFYYKDLNITQRILKKDNASIATSYNNIGLVYYKKNELLKALEFHYKSLKIRKKVLGEKHSLTAISYNNLSLVYSTMKKYSEAYLNNSKAFNLFVKNRDKNFFILDSREKEKYIEKNIYKLRLLLKISIHYYYKLQEDNNQVKSKKILKEVLNNWLNYKGTLFQNQNMFNMILTKSKDSRIKEKILNLRYLIKKLANLEKIKISNQNHQKYNQNIKLINNKISKLEILLGKDYENKELMILLGLKDINLTQIISKLDKNDLYIDFAKVDENYYIFTLDHKSKISFQQVNKHDTKLIEENIKILKDNNHKMVNAIKHNFLTLELEKKLKKESQTIFSTLYTLLIKKHLSKELEEKNKLIISPDGDLNFLPFEALYHNGKYLIEDYQITYTSSGRELIRQGKRKQVKTYQHKMICFGNPDFNSSLAIDTSVNKSLTKGFGGASQGKVVETWEQVQNFSPIGDEELVNIRKLYPNALIYEDKNATVANLMHVDSSQILHFSTHGKFLSNSHTQNPMLNSGLAFAGANDKNNSLRGIATALKLSALDLKDTELVVLSACESGLGKVQNAEGVKGLPKAFLQAGAKNVIMSLWSVSTQKTAMLMRKFYTNVQKKQDYATALRNAKLDMIKEHPYYWSAFIMHGI